MVKRSRHRPFTAVTRVRFPVESPRKKKNTEACSSFFLHAPDGERTRTRFNFLPVINYARRVRARRALRHTRNKPIIRINLLSQSPGGVTCFQVLFLFHYSDGSERGAYISLITQPLSRDAFVLAALCDTPALCLFCVQSFCRNPPVESANSLKANPFLIEKDLFLLYNLNII